MGVQEGKKNGQVVPSEYEDFDYLAKLDPIVEALGKEAPDAKYDRRSLAHTLMSLRQFMEDVMGKDGPAKGTPKLPAKLFDDFRPHGAIFVIALRLHQIKKSRDIRRIDFANSGMRRQILEMVAGCLKELVKRELYKPPCVYLHESCGDQATKLKEMVTKLGGTVAAAQDAPGVTHIVYPFGPKGDPDDGQEYMRVLELRGALAMVHWWYLPDSYDELIPRHEAGDKLEPDKTMTAPWKVYVRWVLDSEKYNEWMNPIDYETEESIEEQEAAGTLPKPIAPPLSMQMVPLPNQARGPAQPPRPGPPQPSAPAPQPQQQQPAPASDAAADQAAAAVGGSTSAAAEASAPRSAAAAAAARAWEAATRPKDASGTGGKDEQKEKKEEKAEKKAGTKEGKADKPPAKRHKALTDAEFVEVEPGAGVRISAVAVKQVCVEVHRAVADGAGGLENISHGHAPQGGSAACLVGQVPKSSALLAASATALPPAAAITHYVPTYSAWFRWDTIHELEEAAVPEFFTGRHPTRTPEVYKAARNRLIETYRARPGATLTLTHATHATALDVDSVRMIWQFLHTWRLINYLAVDGKNTGLGAAHNLLSLKLPTQAEAIAALAQGGGGIAPIGGPRKTAGGVAAATKPGCEARVPGDRVVRIYCAHTGKDCTELRYHCTKHPAIDLSPEAFHGGHFPPGCSAKDFVRMDRRQASEGVDESGWCASETLLLLEALELYGDAWSRVAQHVGTKTQAQCLMHFLQLPIEDPLLDEMEAGPSTNIQPVAPPPTATSNGPTAPAAAGGPHGNGSAGAGPGNSSGTALAGGPASGVLQLPPGTTALPAPRIQLPMSAENGDVEMEEVGVAPDAAAVEAAVTAQLQVPFADSSNPVMAQVSLLSLVLGGRVGAAAASEALAHLSQAAEPGPGGMDVDASQRSLDQIPITPELLRGAAAAGLVAAAAKARALAEQEEHEMLTQVARLVQLQNQKLDIKLKWFGAVDEALEAEIRTADIQRSQMEGERVKLRTIRRSGGPPPALPTLNILPTSLPAAGVGATAALGALGPMGALGGLGAFATLGGLNVGGALSGAGAPGLMGEAPHAQAMPLPGSVTWPTLPSMPK